MPPIGIVFGSGGKGENALTVTFIQDGKEIKFISLKDMPDLVWTSKWKMRELIKTAAAAWEKNKEKHLEDRTFKHDTFDFSESVFCATRKNL